MIPKFLLDPSFVVISMISIVYNHDNFKNVLFLLRQTSVVKHVKGALEK